MAQKVFKGFLQVDGTKAGFSTASLENGYIYFVRTSSADTEDGYLFFNGKKYGRDETTIDCGTY